MLGVAAHVRFARLDGHCRAAARRGICDPHPAAVAAWHRDRRRADGHARHRLRLGLPLHRSDSRADPRHARPCRRQARRAREGRIEGRNRPAGTRLQQHGRQARRAPGGRPEEGTAGAVRPHLHRPGARPLAPDPEHRQQLQADCEDVRRPGVPRELQAHGRAGARAGQAGPRRPAQHRASASARSVSARSEQDDYRPRRVCADHGGGRWAHHRNRDGARAVVTSRGTCSR